ncbi:hypothetical protein BDY17DRAFT_306124 [Neohortaea acidophila]|uniref:Uncharacterized protein n=1 Tax=Neohortaea acidophila TaxID=245834 RepID=A0A6A6PF23_9PEZI|nr:uncharacterized protein BDY17DRAFT_306124 [Neohortaea acidophila]KAF2478542.1 hypothetical protein BDY17DRAFT_306124 [Neohortaea acidophila]
MRLPSRHAPVEEITTNPPDTRRPERSGVPLKAQKLLGEKGQGGFNIEESIIISGNNARATSGIIAPPKAQRLLGERVGIGYADTAALARARDGAKNSRRGLDHISEDDSDTASGTVRSTEYLAPSSSASTGLTAVSPHHLMQQPSIESLSRHHYDSSQQPLHVSQQTSESSVRDMALRKPPLFDPIYGSSSDSTLLTPSILPAGTRRPLASRTPSDEIYGQRRTGMRSLLPQRKLTGRAASTSKSPRTPPSPAGFSEYFPEEPVRMRVLRKGSHFRVEPRARSNLSGRAPVNDAPRTSKRDSFDSPKTNIYRPPKGIKNWFDGLNISSDDDEPEPVELPAGEVPPKDPKLPQQPLPSVFSLYAPQSRFQELPASYRETPPHLKASNYPLSRTSKDTARDRKGSKDSAGSLVDGSVSSGALDGRKRSGESRLARSRLGAESVLSLSSGSEQDSRQTLAKVDSTGSDALRDTKVPSAELPRPQGHASDPAQSTSLEHSSSDTKIDPANGCSSSQASDPFRDGQSSQTATPQMTVRSSGSALSPSSSAIRRNIAALVGSRQYEASTQISYDRDGLESGEEETCSSVPTDASRLMAVTEEEMMLLELMRQKRAAMQKMSFAKGYRLARRDHEQQHHGHGEDAPHNPALLVFKQQVGRRTGGRTLSKTESLIREELQQRKRMSALRREEVDKAFKMGRFLQMDGLNGDRNSKMDRFLVAAPGLGNEFAGRPISGTEIETDSRYDDHEETLSEFDEEEDGDLDGRRESEGYLYSEAPPEHAGRPKPVTSRETAGAGISALPAIPSVSPMQKLTDQVLGLRTERTVHEAGVAAQRPSNGHEGNVRSDTEAETTGGETTDDEVHRRSGGQNLEALQTYSEEQAAEYGSRSKIDSPDTPVATTWARPTSLKHPRPQRQPPVLDFTPLELQHLQGASPSIADSRPSSLMPTFESDVPLGLNPNAPKVLDAVAASARGDNASQSEAPEPLKSHPPGADATAPTLNTIQKQPVRITSMASITSAGEDVLAAWAELGGGSDALGYRRKKNR